MEAPVEEDSGIQLSKNQLKKLKKRDKYLAKKQLLKETRVRKKQPSSVRKKKKLVQITNYKVVLDLEFEMLMTEKELSSTIAQIQYSYADNRNRDLGLDLYCTSVSSNVHQLLGERCKDYRNWKMTFTESHFTEFEFMHSSSSSVDVDNEMVKSSKEALQSEQSISKTKFCYLTADSPNEIQSLSEDTIYIIGALVDHNRYKNLCFEKASELGIAHARLPIGAYVQMQSRKVLTVNHVVGILSEYINHQDWESAFLNVIPDRKGAQKKAAKQDEENGNEANCKENVSA
jgi:tRNA (guanine9-N1)-methyltransferase